LGQYFSRMHWFHCFCRHEPLLVIVYDLNSVGISLFPLKTYPPLIVDPDAVLALSCACELLQLVPRRYSQILRSVGRVEQQKPSECLATDLTGELWRCFSQ